MIAGLLREKIEFQELQTIKSDSGAVRKEFVSILHTRCSKRKLTAVVNKDGINAAEQFIGNIIIIQVRYNPVINDNQQVIYQGRKYSIQLIDRQTSDNSLVITLKKING